MDTMTRLCFILHVMYYTDVQYYYCAYFHLQWRDVGEYCMLVALATIGDLPALLSHWKKYIIERSINRDSDSAAVSLRVHHSKALEALLCTHIFAGIPRCIESLHTVYH